MENTNIFIQNKYLKMLSAKWGPFCSDSNVLRKPWEDFIIGYANVDPQCTKPMLTQIYVAI